MIDNYDIIKNPLTTEKAVKLMETENKLIFVVSKRAKKEDVKKAVQEIFKVKVVSVNIYNTSKSEKRAYVMLSKENPAMDIITELGLM